MSTNQFYERDVVKNYNDPLLARESTEDKNQLTVEEVQASDVSIVYSVYRP